MSPVSYARRITDLAAADPERPLVTCGEVTANRAEFESAANRLARRLAAEGVGPGDMVTIALPNSVAWFVAMAAAWKLGAIPQPVSPKLPPRELLAIIELADPPVVIGVDPAAIEDEVEVEGRRILPAAAVDLFGELSGHAADTARRPAPGSGDDDGRGGAGPETAPELAGTAELDDSPLPDAVSPSWKAPTSGGSTGRPKLILSGDPAVLDIDRGPRFGTDPDGCLVMPGPLSHNGPLVWSCLALVWGSHVVVLPRFDAEATLAAIERHRAHMVYLVPTMMKRILRLPEEVRSAYDLSSLRLVWHLAEPCPPWLKEAWIDWLGPERIFELYAGTEAQVITVISGTEWLEHRGSVGRAMGGEIMITDPEGRRLPPGELGEVWMRSEREAPSYRYVGAHPRRLGEEGWGHGWESLGDMGWLDEDGYLYLADRAQDMILVGGANVYPAEVEAALQEHPACRSCAVIGLPDEDRGNRVHAIVEADPGALSEDELRRFLADRLASYKVPRSFELVDIPLRDDAGKVRRAALRAERLPDSPPASG